MKDHYLLITLFYYLFHVKGLSMYLIATRTGETADRICTYILHIGGLTNSSILQRFPSQ